MDEQKEQKQTPFDAEWEFAKIGGRFTDILGMIEDLKAKDKSLSARISRLRLASIEEDDDTETLEEEEARVRSKSPRAIENLSLEERAILIARLTDRE